MHGERDVDRRLPAGAGQGGDEARMVQRQQGLARAAAACREQLAEIPADQQAHEFGLRRVRGGPPRDRPVAHHRDPVGDPRHLLQPVRDVDDADAASAQLAHHGEQVLGLGRRKCRGGLVQDQDAGIRGQRLGDRHQLPLAHPQRGDAQRRIEIDAGAGAGEQVVRLSHHARAIEGAAPGEALMAEEQVGGDVEPRHQVEFLRDHDDAGGVRLARGAEPDRLARQGHAAGIGCDRAGDHAHQRALAGPILAE